ncbi:hypothetical protein NXH64_10915 [Butyrivibrio fibrisolvens]|uniref:sigma factor-like helix-turn-helix DNA-binding protein n=1 Tax=Pseudobutyrivibrio ruminis TaxID=46206 RepID=UPI0004075594|nr:sigma factor-like helix-turn-helix DNA-binding protein [Pseudobutyrivibrio ruminis]MDC7280010.1 hypothetical protein [Butyrivibrio fibrisolvens]
MESVKNITELIKAITLGVDPTTGERVDIEILKKDKDFQDSLRELLKKVNLSPGKSMYTEMEEAYPNHVIIQLERYMYCAHNRSAFVLNQLLEYRLIIDRLGRPTTGGPDYDKISNVLKAAGVSFLCVSKGELVEVFNGENPFDKYRVDVSDYEALIESIVTETGLENNDEITDKNTVMESDEKKHLSEEIENNRKKQYPYNLLEKILPDQEMYPEDIEQRIMAIIEIKKDGRYGRDYECILKYYRDGMTLAEIGYEYTLTGERVRQLIARGLRRLKSKDNIRYLNGKADTLIVPAGKISANILSSTSVNVEAIPFYNSKISEDAFSISKTLMDLFNQGISEKRLQYIDVIQWFYSVGDINVYEENGKNIYVPTAQGDLHGIKRGIGKTVSGKEFFGILLEPTGQKYISDNLHEIIKFIDE